MTDKEIEFQHNWMTCHVDFHSVSSLLHFIAFLALVLMMTVCGSVSATPAEVTIQAALPTPTLEPTFTPSPSPTDSPIPTPTDTPPPEPTPLPVPRGSVSGRILDRETNQPIAEAEVSAGDQTTTTNANGRYNLTGLEPGQYVLSVTHPDYDPGLSSIFTLVGGQDRLLDLSLYAPETSPYPQDPMLTNPLDPNGAPTKTDAERLARLQGLTGEVVNIEETKLSGEYLVNYRIGDDMRAAVAELNHEAWELTDETGRKWRVIKVCGNLASPLPQEAPIATPAPRPLPPLAEVVVDGLVVRACTSEECVEVGTVRLGVRVEVFGCLADGGWCEVGWPGGRGWCTGRSLQQLAIAEAVPVMKAVLPTATPGVMAKGVEKIAFMCNQLDGNVDICVINVDGSDLKRLTSDPSQDWYPAWSPDGQQIAFSRWSDNMGTSSDIYVMDADGSNQRRLTNNGDKLDWSPDGQQIVFTGDGPGIYIMNADGSGLSHLTEGVSPAWSPDSQRIAFVNSGIYVINVDGSGLMRLTDQTAAQFPAWSPDGQRIAFQANTDGDPGNHEIFMINADGSGLTPLTDSPDADRCPTWSPDGQQIAFTRGYLNITVMNADGSNQRRLIDGDFPDWSP